MSQFIEMFENHNYMSVPLAELIDKSFPGEWGTEDENGNGTKVIRTTNITNSDKLDLSDVVTRNIVAAKLQKKQLCRGDILLERSGGTKDNPVGRVAYFDEDGVFVTNNFTQTLRCNNNIESRYLFYFLYYFYNLNKMKIRSMGNQTTGIQNLNMDDYMQISVIVPPRDLQKQFISIVTQADKSKFVGFKSQFIEMFKNESLQVPLEKIVEVKDDCRKPINEGERSEMKEGDLYPYYGATGIVDYINDYITDEELLCIAEDCGNYKAGEESAYIIRGKAWVNNHAHLVKVKDNCDIKYLYYYLKITNLMPYVSGTTRLKLTQKKLKEILVTLPSAELQNRFVAIAEQADKSKYLN